MKRILQILIGLLLCVEVKSQLKLDAEIRPRTEYRHGYRTLPEKSDQGIFLTTQRTRFNVSYDQSRIESHISFQDIRVWGNEGTVGLFQGWLKFKMGNQLSIKLGRQELAYDDYKILGNSNWRNQGRTHDVIVAEVISKDSTVNFHAGFGVNNDDEFFKNFYDESNYKNLIFSRLNKQFNQSAISLLFLTNGFQSPDSATYYTSTSGIYFSKSFGNMLINGNYYRQFGKNISGINISAYLISLQATYKFTEKLKSILGFDALSGIDGKDLLNPDFKKDNSFSIPHANAHRQFGQQDMFYAGGFHVVPGLVDFYLKYTYNIGKDLKANLDFHNFSSHATLVDPLDETNKMRKRLGTEIDFNLSYSYSPDFLIKAGYTQFYSTETMEVLKGSGNKNALAYFAFVSFEYKPVFTKK